MEPCSEAQIVIHKQPFFCQLLLPRRLHVLFACATPSNRNHTSKTGRCPNNRPHIHTITPTIQHIQHGTIEEIFDQQSQFRALFFNALAFPSREWGDALEQELSPAGPSSGATNMDLSASSPALVDDNAATTNLGVGDVLKRALNLNDQECESADNRKQSVARYKEETRWSQKTFVQYIFSIKITIPRRTQLQMNQTPSSWGACGRSRMFVILIQISYIGAARVTLAPETTTKRMAQAKRADKTSEIACVPDIEPLPKSSRERCVEPSKRI